jgi:hypothetical protein
MQILKSSKTIPVLRSLLQCLLLYIIIEIKTISVEHDNIIKPRVATAGRYAVDYGVQISSIFPHAVGAKAWVYRFFIRAE